MVSSKGKGVIFSPTLLILIRKQTIVVVSGKRKLALQSAFRFVCSRTTIFDSVSLKRQEQAR